MHGAISAQPMGVHAIGPHGFINRRWLPLNALRAFEAVGSRLSFTAGAQALTVTQSAMSRHVSSLEDLIGKPLFERSASGLRLTPAGEMLLPVVSKCLDRIEQTLNMVRDQTLESRPLRVHIPPSLLYQTALPLLHGFRREHPDIRIDVCTSNVTGPPPGNVDVAIVFDRPNVDDRVTDLLWMVRVAPLCSPGTWEQHRGKTLEQFLNDTELLHVKLENEPRSLLWSSYADQQRIALDCRGGLAFDTAFSAVRYAIGASGVVLADIDMFASEISAGNLVMPFEAVAADGYGYYLKMHAEDLADPALFLFRDWIIRHFAGGAAHHEARGDMSVPVELPSRLAG
ncbi:LysR family transcriptional regulator [Novosphingobium flavum]|uniref:LysR family transcriptional regulator n=2 Tax=Novosphingobium aerophilum TaxID=2839843 RepID=A0A7X1F758_9SPHN|nr:LysR family transcriptional regulator [Novosphingobium aerophilum]MBC2661235.1 LysR family transcriptional regulator [Novosphingobium aerophilum]